MEKFSYNTGYHTSTGTTPFFVVYGREPMPLLPYVAGETKNHELEQQLINRDDMLKLLRTNLFKAQDRMRNQANSKRRELSFEVGDYVAYELSLRFFGPYHIKRVVGPVAYELDLPPAAKIHPIFHVSLLKQAYCSFSDDSVNPLPITKD